jgi:hypothetical protein
METKLSEYLTEIRDIRAAHPHLSPEMLATLILAREVRNATTVQVEVVDAPVQFAKGSNPQTDMDVTRVTTHESQNTLKVKRK